MAGWGEVSEASLVGCDVLGELGWLSWVGCVDWFGLSCVS